VKPNLSDTVTISPNLRFSEIVDEVVLLDLASEKFYCLDEVGTQIWRLLQKNRSLRSVYEILREEFDVESARLENDLLKHISELADAGLVTIDEKDVAAS